MSFKNKEAWPEQTHFFDLVDAANPEYISLEGPRTLQDVLTTDFIPTLLFIESLLPKTNIIIHRDMLESAVAWAVTQGNLEENDISPKDIPDGLLEVHIYFSVLLFRDVYSSDQLMKMDRSAPVAHRPGSEAWEKELRFALKDRLAFWQTTPAEEGLKPHERGASTGFIKLIPRMMHFPNSLSLEDRLHGHGLLLKDLFEKYWFYLRDKARLLEGLELEESAPTKNRTWI